MIDEKALSALLQGEITLRMVEPHIYSIYHPGEHTNTFDRGASFYDLVMGNRVYNHLFWGYSISEFAPFCQDALNSSIKGFESCLSPRQGYHEMDIEDVFAAEPGVRGDIHEFPVASDHFVLDHHQRCWVIVVPGPGILYVDYLFGSVA